MRCKSCHSYRRLSAGDRMDGDDLRWRPPSLLLVFLLICMGLLFFVDVFQLEFYTATAPTAIPQPLPATTALPHEFTEAETLRGFLVKTPGCRIPDMDPLDPTVVEFVHGEERPVCNGGLPALVEADAETSTLRVDAAALAAYSVGENETHLLRCCYRPFWRVDKTDRRDKLSALAMSPNCTEFDDGGRVAIAEEFVKVECSRDGVDFYDDFFSFVPLKASRWRTADGRRPLNVLIVGLDAVSRLNLLRQMPQTVEYLRQLKIHDMLGYNKVGDNTFPNIIPVLTGLDEEELRRSCWPTSDDYFDHCPIIWDDYAEMGFATSYAEDASWMGIFNYQRNGFRKQPTDYMWSFFDYVADHHVGNQHLGNANHCYGSREVYRMAVDYVRRFARTMCEARRPYFSFNWGVSLSHDFLNFPKLGDGDYKALFRELRESGCLNETVLVFMSDHGIRWGGIRYTYQGRMEERLPFLQILLPDWYQEEFPRAVANLRKNSRRLTTPFDLHETLKDLLDPYQLTAQYLERWASRGPKRAYSLFETIPVNRTCEDAAIAPHWCTCQKSVPIPANDTVVLEAANFTVTAINRKLDGYRQCASLTLEEVLDARLRTHDGPILDGSRGSVDYTINFRTSPGDGVFEVTVRADPEPKNNGSGFALTGTISRLNLYGKQSLCITDFHLKLYCYCKNILL